MVFNGFLIIMIINLKFINANFKNVNISIRRLYLNKNCKIIVWIRDFII